MVLRSGQPNCKFQGFREAFAEECKEAAAVDSILTTLFTLLDPLRAQSIDFLRELEFRYSTWSTRLEASSRVSSHNHHRHGHSSASTSTTANANSAAVSSSTSAEIDVTTEQSPPAPVRIGDLFVTNLKMLQVGWLTSIKSIQF